MRLQKKKKFDRRKLLKDSVYFIESTLTELQHEDLIEFVRNDSFKKCLPFGQKFDYIFSYYNFKFVHAENSIDEVLGITRSDLLNTTIDQVFLNLIAPEHIISAVRFSKKALEIIEAHPNRDVVVNFEFNIYKGGKESRRLLNQWRTAIFTEELKPLVLYGSYVDITHMIASGPPKLYFVVDGLLKDVETGTFQEMLSGLNIEISEKELRLVYLRSAKGMHAKEISREIGLTVSSVYSSIKNIKEKIGMDIGPLYEFLRGKGLFKSDQSGFMP
ncbi:MAG: hypothetical protein V9E90_13205 [Saprospiraceae bacterium]|jgi:hypothetical protein